MNRPRRSRAADQSAYRRRRDGGMRQWPLVADAVAMEHALVEGGWLAPGDTDDRRKVLAAFKRADMRIEVLPRDVQRRDESGLCIVSGNHLEDDR
jgi:hypothetical protein